MLWQGVAKPIKTSFLTARTRIQNEDIHALVGPFPVTDFRKIVAILTNIFFVLGQFAL
jgi:hypothetical protein